MFFREGNGKIHSTGETVEIFPCVLFGDEETGREFEWGRNGKIGGMVLRNLRGWLLNSVGWDNGIA